MIGLVLLAPAAAGCGTTKIDPAKAEGFVRGAIGPPPPRSVHCPGGIAAEDGHTFQCQAVLANGEIVNITLHIVRNAQVEVGPGDVHPVQGD